MSAAHSWYPSIPDLETSATGPVNGKEAPIFHVAFGVGSAVVALSVDALPVGGGDDGACEPFAAPDDPHAARTMADTVSARTARRVCDDRPLRVRMSSECSLIA